MAIKILIKRHFKEGTTEQAFALIKNFRQDAMHRSGYISGAIADAVSSLALDYTALNFIISDGRDLYVLRNFTKQVNYYTLYY